VAELVHWKLCEKLNFERSDKWYEHARKLLWDMNIQCDYVIEAKRPDLKIVDKVEKTAMIIDP